MTERQGHKNANSLARIFAKIGFPGGSDEHQRIQQRLAYKIWKCEKVYCVIWEH